MKCIWSTSALTQLIHFSSLLLQWLSTFWQAYQLFYFFSFIPFFSWDLMGMLHNVVRTFLKLRLNLHSLRISRDIFFWNFLLNWRSMETANSTPDQITFANWSILINGLPPPQDCGLMRSKNIRRHCTGYSFWDRLRNFLHKFTWIVLSVHKLNKLGKFW